MKNTMRITATVICLLALAMLLVACTPTQTPTQSAGATATPTPEPSVTPTEEIKNNLMKAGDHYRIMLCDNTVEDNEYLFREGNEQMKEDWLEYQDKYGVTITWIKAPSDWIHETMDSAVSGEPICDIMNMGGPFTVASIICYNGTTPGTYLAQLDAYGDDADFSDSEYWATEAQEQGCVYNGKLYAAVPREVSWSGASLHQVTFFNTDLISKGGYTKQNMYDMYNNGTWTFEAYKELALKCTDVDNGIFGATMSANVMCMIAMIAANNGHILTYDESGVPEFTAVNKNSMDAINFFLDMCKVDKSVCLDGLGTYQGQDEANLFVKGTIATMVTYANRRIQGRQKTWQTMDFGIILPPKGPAADDYISDYNWAIPYCVMKDCPNPAGAVQCVATYIKRSYGVTSEESMMHLEADASSYFKDEQSIQTLKDTLIKNQTTTYMFFWNQKLGDGEAAGNLCNVLVGHFGQWIEGSSTPEVDFAAGVDAVNIALREMMGDKG